MLIGRENEIKELMEKYNSLESSFVAIYGRRRIEKTYLNNQKMIFTIKIYSYLLYCVISLHNKNKKYCEKYLHNGYNKVYNVIEGD